MIKKEKSKVAQTPSTAYNLMMCLLALPTIYTVSSSLRLNL